MSEARVVNNSGRVEWVQRSRDKHFLDAEALAAAAGFEVGIQRIRDGSRQRPPEQPASTQPQQAAAPTPPNRHPYYTDGTPRTTPVRDEHGDKVVLANYRPLGLADVGDHPANWDDFKGL